MQLQNMTGQSAQAQPNIALIKYWGKSDRSTNLPAVDSLSLTLDALQTQTSVTFDESLVADVLHVNGAAATEMLPRVTACLDQVCGTSRVRCLVDSQSNFPIAAGLASSASAFAALVVAADHVSGEKRGRLELARIAGRASGSAARSLYGGIVALNVSNAEINVEQISEPGGWPLEVVVAITEEGPKPLGSGEAMIRSEATSPFYGAWVERQDADLADARRAVDSQDFFALAEVAEHNCLKMHSVTWSSRPPIVYWNKATLACMETIRQLRADGCPVFFTIDAGPQVKAICLPDVAETVDKSLRAANGVLRTIRCGLGSGARMVSSQ